MSLERYRSVQMTDRLLALMVGSSTRTNFGPDDEVEINLTVGGLKSELDAFMATAGFEVVGTDLDSPLPQIFASWQGQVISNTITTPPVGPSTGDRYIVPVGASGVWTTKVGDIAEWNGAAWWFQPATEGFFAYVLSQSSLFFFSSAAAWVPFSSGGTSRQESIVTETINGTDTTLADPLDFEPRDPAAVQLQLNGVVQVQGPTRDYILTGGTNQSIEWRASSGIAVNMATTDELIAYYISSP